MFEKHNSRSRSFVLGIPLLAVVLLGCSSCGEDDSTPEEREQKAIEGSPDAVAEYYPNGTRILSFRNTPRGSLYADILQICDGADLVEETDNSYRSGNAPARSVAHPACEDGMLTAEDFEIPG